MDGKSVRLGIRVGLGLVLINLFVWGWGQGRTAYIATTTAILGGPGGAAIGSLTPGTPVAVLKEQGKFSQVQIQAWSPKGGNAALFAGPGQRILLGSLSNLPQAQRVVKGQAKDPSDQVWEQAEVVAWVNKTALIPDVSALWKRASTTYQKRCSTCHALPATDKYTANQWPGTLRGMAQRAGLSKDDTELLVRYVQAHAKK